MARADKKKYGNAAQNGVLRYVSASSLQTFSPNQDGRRWYFENVLGFKAKQQTVRR